MMKVHISAETRAVIISLILSDAKYLERIQFQLSVFEKTGGMRQKNYNSGVFKDTPDYRTNAVKS